MKKFMSVNVKRLWVALGIFFILPIVAFAATPTAVSQFGTTLWDFGYKVAADSDGNIFVTGDLKGNFSGSYPNTVATQDGFLRKMDSTGNLLWSVPFSTPVYDEIRGLAVDSNGNAFVCGTTYGSFVPGFGGSDIFVAKVSPSGEVLWIDQSGTIGGDSATSIEVDAEGNAYVAGWTSGSMDGVRTPVTGYEDALVMKYSSDGQRVWTRQFNTAPRPLGNRIHGLCVYKDRVYVTGLTNGSEAGNLFLYAFDLNGTFQWKQLLAQSGVDKTGFAGENTAGKAVTADDSGVYICGVTLGFQGGFEGTPYLGGTWDAFIIKFDLNGNKLWSNLIGTAGSDLAYDVKTDSVGDVYLVGSTDSSLDGQTRIGSSDAFIIKYSSQGTKLYTHLIGTTTVDSGYGICLDPTDNIIITGTTQGTFPGQVRAGGYDAFVMVYPSEVIVPEVIVVPNVINLADTIAEKTITDAKLKVGAWDSYYSNSPVNTVISQDPAAGTLVSLGTPVALIVSLGAEPVVTPPVVVEPPVVIPDPPVVVPDPPVVVEPPVVIPEPPVVTPPVVVLDPPVVVPPVVIEPPVVIPDPPIITPPVIVEPPVVIPPVVTDPDDKNKVTATIIVLNQENHPLSGVQVTLKDKDGIFILEATTGSDGKVIVQLKKAGKVWIYKDKIGYTSVVDTDVQVINRGAKNIIVSYMM